jgi:hypothetical protein
MCNMASSLAAALMAGVVACGGPARPADELAVSATETTPTAADVVVDPATAANGAVPGLALVTLPDLERPALRHPVARIERDEHVRAPDDLIVATVTLVDAVDLGIVDESTDPPTLSLSQAPCRFVEAEPDAVWDALDATDCRGFHQDQFDGRGHRAIRLDAGAWQIAVTNASVGRVVGLWLRSEDPSIAPLVSSGGIGPGERLTWSVELEPGRYLYSCPLNPTANYLIEVE